MAKHSKAERERRAGRIAPASPRSRPPGWAACPPATAKAFTVAVEAARARGPEPRRPDMAPGHAPESATSRSRAAYRQGRPARPRRAATDRRPAADASRSARSPGSSRPARPAPRSARPARRGTSAGGGTRPGPRRPGAARCRSARGRRSRGGAASRRGSGPRSRRGGSPRPSLARKRATPVVSSVGSTSSIFDSPTPRKAIRTWSVGMSMTVSSSRPRRVAPEPERRRRSSGR